jgi:hypothetical protein
MMSARYDILAAPITLCTIDASFPVTTMRWKLLALAAITAALVGIGLWSVVAIACFGTASNLARHDWILLASALIPLGMTTYASIFVYRHTSRRRKTQAAITAVLTLFLTSVTYLLASQVSPHRLTIPRTSGMRNAR